MTQKMHLFFSHSQFEFGENDGLASVKFYNSRTISTVVELAMEHSFGHATLKNANYHG